LLQLKIASEDSKFGMTQSEAITIIASEEFSELKHIAIKGVMGMATFTEDKKQIQQEFKNLKSIFKELKQIETVNLKLETISMGMSSDYLLAIECGSTMVRVGSSIFGERN